ncbi:Hint domain-containing protein [Shimia aestuarii]|uniref:Hint domain-containing protein n=1 Tax=Shimia aestuarii TaxID=254406 RepID=UPI001FB2EE07|nr:Hint domain-containing protein [Shimia aestuarii]
MPIAQELTYDTGASATEMAQEIFGDGVTVVNASYSGSNGSSAIYSNGDTISPEATPGDTGVILSTGNVRDFTNSGGGGWWGGSSTNTNQSSSTSTNTSGENNNPLFNNIVGSNTYDAAYLEVQFIPTGDTMTMQFVFSSEEYPEYINSIYNDAVIVMVNGEEVEVAVGSGNASISTVNTTNNSNLYLDNTGDAYNTEMDGFTVTMTLTMDVDPGELNEILIGIVDVGDSSYDSNVLIAGDSVQTAVIANADWQTMGLNATKTVDVLDNDEAGSTLTITHINGQPVEPGDTIVLSTGQVITLNADGTLEVTSDGDEEEVNFTYTIEDESGTSDVGFVTINSTAVPCFVKGTLIRTPEGDVPVEDIDVGDLVETYENGAQEVRWIGSRTVPAEGALAPIRIEAESFGDHGTLLVSPQHRVLLRDSRAELLFDSPEVLVKAKDLIDDQRVTRETGGDVTYFHMLFDSHQLVFSQGLETESFLPGPEISNIFEEEIVEEIFTLFPELDRETGEGYGPAARRLLKTYEAAVLTKSGKRVA